MPPYHENQQQQSSSSAALYEDKQHPPPPPLPAPLPLQKSNSSGSNGTNSRDAAFSSLEKNALDGMICSVRAVLDLLASNGVSRAAIAALADDFAADHYIAAMERAQEYAQIIYDNKQQQSTRQHRVSQQQSSDRPRQHSTSGMIGMLLIVAWESLHRYLALQYRRAHRHHQTLRWSDNSKSALSSAAAVAGMSVSDALDEKIRLAEECCAAQKGLILAQGWQRRCSMARKTTAVSSSVPEASYSSSE